MLMNKNYKVKLEELNDRLTELNDKLTEIVNLHSEGKWIIGEKEYAYNITKELNEVRNNIENLEKMNFIRRMFYKG